MTPDARRRLRVAGREAMRRLEAWALATTRERREGLTLELLAAAQRWIRVSEETRAEFEADEAPTKPRARRQSM